MSSADFLLEIRTEELPPLALQSMAAALAEGLVSSFAEAGIAHRATQIFATPRRLAVLIRHLALRQPDRQVERRGPPVSAAFDSTGRPTQAALAFAKTCGVSVEALQQIDTPKGKWLNFSALQPGADTAGLIPGFVHRAIGTMPIPKRMRWGAHTAEFVRPVHSLIVMLGEAVIDTTEFEIRSGRTTIGHRFHAPRPLQLKKASQYAGAMRRAKVVADFNERRRQIAEGVATLAETLGGRALINPALLDEVTALVEWPVPLAGQFDERFLALPREVIISTIEHHQRYFPVEDPAGQLSRRFITVANIDSRDPDKVREGNERVVRPRLSDAAFFWEQDRKHALRDAREALKAVTFQTKLGSQFDKSERVKALALRVGAQIGADPAFVTEAAELAKCDLLSGMVGEFPELQGTIGRYYALHDGCAPEVASAIEEQYRPRFAGDSLPATRTGQALALADRLDTLAGIFVIDQKPSGTKDPFGLRRAALGVLRILLESGLDINLRELIGEAVEAQPVARDGVAREVDEFINERLRGVYLERGQVSTEMFDAVAATAPASPIDFDLRIRALQSFLDLPQATALATANKRIANILKKAPQGDEAAVDPGAFVADAERDLFAALRTAGPRAEAHFAARRYAEGMSDLAQLRETVDGFFDRVMVMDDDERRRKNRLALLAELRSLFSRVADLSRLPG